MLDKITLFFTPKDGDLNFEKPGFLKELAKTLPAVRHLMTITIFRNRISSNQMRYMFGVVYKLIGNHTGYTKEEVHQIFGKKYRSYEKNGITFVRSITDLNTEETENYLKKVRMFADIELRVVVPLPNEPDNFYYEVK